MNDYKRIPFLNVRNCRDLGGYACGEKGFFRYHRLYRSDVPLGLTEEEWGKVQGEMNVRTIIDLRSLSEQNQMRYLVPDGIKYMSLPLMKEEINLKDLESIESVSANAFGRSLTEGYAGMVRDNTKQVVRVIQTIADSLEDGAVLYHCTGGKDRTGVISALLYLICGAAEADIIADYQVTAAYIAGKWMMEMDMPKQFKEMLKSSPETIREFLQTVKEEAFLERLIREGLTQETIAQLRKNIVDLG